MLRHLRRESGYTLLESLFQLAIMVAFLHLIILFFYWKYTIERQIGSNSSTEWELFTAELQTSLSQVNSIELEMDGRALLFRNERGMHTISQSGSVIRKTVDSKGHVPLFTNSQSVLFSIEGEMVRMKVVTVDEKIKERRFAVGLYPE
ncbi:competence type IV pilus minor pilin ComGF [Sporosarcina sp. Te-1]|uniref:competence type IV pilus minor pilin ComGF n=1 Tax=Sporosarcina sp. Te-1 TaxID=2818390 RepID=UPI001A9FB3E5|nr:competence type IV pilus minor pilin ComGF [Sporosarcina sp. Te-1]QTD41704.1 ComGF family competence protein [Sporosarcina sp. Te-1]